MDFLNTAPPSSIGSADKVEACLAKLKPLLLQALEDIAQDRPHAPREYLIQRIKSLDAPGDLLGDPGKEVSALKEELKDARAKIAHLESELNKKEVEIAKRDVQLSKEQSKMVRAASLTSIGRGIGPLTKSLIFILGAPGTGKRTQSDMFRDQGGFDHLNLIALVRNQADKGGSLGVVCRELLKHGVDIPVDIGVSILKQCVEDSPSTNIVISDFPQSVMDAYSFEEKVGKATFAILLECPSEKMKTRAEEKSHGMVVDPAAWKQRCERYSTSLSAVANYFDFQGKLLKVDGGLDPQEVFDSYFSQVVQRCNDLQRLRDLFHQFDADNSNTIDFTELRRVFSSVGKELTDEDLHRIKDKYDEDQSGALSLSEFISMAQRELSLIQKTGDFHQAFKDADCDGNGFLDESDLLKIFSKLGQDKTSSEVKEILNQYAANPRGINLQEFQLFSKAYLVDVAEMKDAMDFVQRLALDPGGSGQGEECQLGTGDSGQLVPAGDGVLVDMMCDLVRQNDADFWTIHGVDQQETNTIHAVVTKLVLDMLVWEAGDLEDLSLPDLLKKVANTRGWDWKNQEGKKENSLEGMAEWFEKLSLKHGGAKVSDLLCLLIEEHKPTIDALSRRFGPLFDETYLTMLSSLVRWESPKVDLQQLLALEEPAVFAFSFGTGDKIGDAVQMPSLVGPGCETPGKTNQGLAEMINKILEVRPMPVYAQWEIADALLHGERGAPEGQCRSFHEWQFGDTLKGGEVEKAKEWYKRVEQLPLESGMTVPVMKSLPIWPLAIRQHMVDSKESLRDEAVMRKFYLSTVGVMEQNKDMWDCKVAPKPKSVVVVAHLDHAKRCKKLVEEMLLTATDGTKQVMGIPCGEIPVNSFYPEHWDHFQCDQFGYDPVSSQKWTRNRALFIAHEATARNMTYVRGDYGPLPIHRQGPAKVAKGGEMVAKKLAAKSGALIQLLGPSVESMD